MAAIDDVLIAMTEMSFRLINYTATGTTEPRAGLKVGEVVVDVGSALADGDYDASSTIALVRNWEDALPKLESLAATGKEDLDFADVNLAAPLLYPSNIFCAGANYSDHFKEMSGREADKSVLNPYFFNKVVRQTVIGPGDEIKRPRITQKLDWEAEICVVIGKSGRNIDRDNALDHVAGYTIVNDLSARDFLWREDWPALKTDWLWQKSFDTSAPMGPWITPRSEIPDAQNLRINTFINGELRQDTHSELMIFTVPELIEALAEHFTLLAGDVIATGTGSGVGHVAKSFLQPGDVCRIEIEGLGTLENPIVEGE